MFGVPAVGSAQPKGTSGGGVAELAPSKISIKSKYLRVAPSIQLFWNEGIARLAWCCFHVPSTDNSGASTGKTWPHQACPRAPGSAAVTEALTRPAVSSLVRRASGDLHHLKSAQHHAQARTGRVSALREVNAMFPVSWPDGTVAVRGITIGFP